MAAFERAGSARKPKLSLDQQKISYQGFFPLFLDSVRAAETRIVLGFATLYFLTLPLAIMSRPCRIYSGVFPRDTQVQPPGHLRLRNACETWMRGIVHLQERGVEEETGSPLMLHAECVDVGWLMQPFVFPLVY